MPVYNPPETFLRRAIQSIKAQVYSNWELCIADDCSTAPHVEALLEQYACEDARIKVCRRQENGGIAAATNSALALASGDYVALIDQDDEIPPHALLLVAKEIAAHPEVDLIYSDEDKLDAGGRRFDPYFKPDWNPALILSQNFFSHLGVYRRSLIEQAGGFRDVFQRQPGLRSRVAVLRAHEPRQNPSYSSGSLSLARRVRIGSTKPDGQALCDIRGAAGGGGGPRPARD